MPHLWRLQARQIGDRRRAAELVSAVGATTGCSISTVKALLRQHRLEHGLRAVRRHANRTWVLLYIERWLKAPMQMEDGSIVPRNVGNGLREWVMTALHPVVNLFLHYALTCGWREGVPTSPGADADDAICRCKSAEEAQGLWRTFADRFAARKLVLQSREDEDRLLRKDANRTRRLTIISFDFSGIPVSGPEDDVEGRHEASFAHSRNPPPARRR